MGKSEITFYAAAFLFLGIVFGSFSISFFWVIIPFLFALGWFRYVNHTIDKKVSILFLSAALLGVFYYHGFAVFEERREILPQNDEVFFGVVVGESKILEKTQIVPLKLLPPHRGQVTIFTTPLADFSYGEQLEIRGAVKNSLWPDENILSFPGIRKKGMSEGSLRQALINNKESWLRNFKILFSSHEATLLGGLTFGARGDFSEELRETMRRSGTTHIVALSGYNISILIWALERLLRSRFSRRFFFWLTMSLIGAFVLMVGAEASVTRAAIMGALILIATETGRFYSFRHAVLFAALGMSLWDPSLVRYDLGFQLSFLSLLGIALFEPILRRVLWGDEKKGSFLSWRENLSATISAQVAVLPVLALNFGVFSLTSILANVLILWAIPFIMALGFVTALLSLVHISLGFILQPLLHLALSYMLFIINGTALMSPVDLLWNGWLTLGYYIVLILIIFKYTDYEEISS